MISILELLYILWNKHFPLDWFRSMLAGKKKEYEREKKRIQIGWLNKLKKLYWLKEKKYSKKWINRDLCENIFDYVNIPKKKILFRYYHSWIDRIILLFSLSLSLLLIYSNRWWLVSCTLHTIIIIIIISSYVFE